MDSQSIYNAIHAWIELNNFITIKDWSDLSDKEAERTHSSHGIDVCINDFYAVGFGSVSESIVHSIFRKQLSSTDVYSAATELLEEFKREYSTYPDFDPKECDDYIDESVDDYIRRETEFEIDICADNAKYCSAHMPYDDESNKRLDYWLHFYSTMGEWLTNVKVYLDERRRGH